MYLKEVRIWNFRKYGQDGDNPGLVVKFHKGINLLVGENDAGKTTIIDAIKIALQTHSNEFLKVVEEDFHIIDENNSASEIKIQCLFEDFSKNEAKNYLEWIEYYMEGNCIKYRLKLTYRAWLENHKIFNEVRAGANEEGNRLDGKARELLKTTYLRPLRDAEREMKAGKNSRLSQILRSYSIFSSGENHKLVEILKTANEEINTYFKEGDGKEILDKIVKYLNDFSVPTSTVDAKFITAAMKLKGILESLTLALSETQPGLGSLNLLFIATELLLLNNENEGALRLALIEEIEAHLHPQAQLRLIDFIQKEYNDSDIQFILSTHSSNISSKINIKNILLCRGHNVFSLAPEETKLEKGDYLFLQRFLDVTKANMFFAQGILMVEGDAEQLLLPTIAEIIDCSLSKSGISLMNIGSVAFSRYARILLQKDDRSLGVRVAIVTDCDIRPSLSADNNTVIEDEIAVKAKIKAKEDLYNEDIIQAFVAPHWTLEYVIALSILRREFYKAVLCAKKIQNSDKYALTSEKILEVEQEVNDKFAEWESNKRTEEWIAYEIYNNTMLAAGNKISKAIVAQCFANILWYEILDLSSATTISEEMMFDIDMYRQKIDESKKEVLKNKILEDKQLRYLVNAIKYVVGQECVIDD